MRGAMLASVPAGLFALGVAGAGLVQPGVRLELERPLAELPREIGPYSTVREAELGEAELLVLRPDDYLLRTYEDPEGHRMDLFASFYGRQIGGGSIHSPRNCLPGAGWEPVRHDRIFVSLGREREAPINRYVIQDERGRRALVYYWYQGRGRITASEYRVKWDLLRDAVIAHRTDEALVRLVFPLTEGTRAEDGETRSSARRVARQLALALAGHLPDG